MLNDMSIRARLYLGFSIIMAIILSMSALGIYKLSSIYTTMDDLVTIEYQQADIANDIYVVLLKSQNSLRGMTTATDDPSVIKERLSRLRESLSNLKDHADKLVKAEGNSVSKKDTLKAQTLSRSIAYYDKGLIPVIILAEQGDGAGAWALYKKDVESLYRDIQKNLDTYLKEHRSTGKSGLESAKKEFSNGRFLLLILTSVSFLLAFILAWRITLAIVKPLQHAVSAARSISKGDLTIEIHPTHRTDEVSLVLTAMKDMVEYLRTVIHQVTNTSSQVSTAASRLQTIAAQIATESEEASAQATTVATAGEEMSATAGDIAQNCQLAAEGAQLTSKSAQNGAQVVDNTVTVMGQIALKVKESAKTMESLGARSDQIGAIIGTIEDIADQTNLLALNAAIEAARAGEQGRGFAVVADEVRALAERTTRATKEIGEMIKAIQKETRNAVNAMEQGVLQVETGTKEASRSGEALSDILEQINSVVMQVNQIATAAEEQTATTGEISSNMHQITEVVQQTSFGANKTTEAAIQLNGNAAELMRVVQQFKL